ncbi:MAG TPA: PAS domain S-box protein [Cytophagaceae bacterium]
MNLDKSKSNINQLLSAVLNKISDAFIIADASLKITYLNKAAESLTGIEISDGITVSIGDIFLFPGVNDNKTLATVISQSSSDGVLASLTNLKTGEVKAVVVNTEVVEAGEACEYVFIFKEEKHTPIQEKDDKYRALFDNAKEGILVLDADATILDVNPAACEIYNKTKEEFLNLKVTELFPHKTEVELRELWRDFLQNGSVAGLYKYYRSEKDIRYIEFHAKTNFLPALHLAVLEDVTEKKATERALKTSEAHYKAIFNYSPNQIVLLDLNYKVITANENAQQSALAFMGKKLEAGESILKYTHPADKAKTISIFERVKKGELIVEEYHPRGNNKKGLWIEITFIPVRDAYGNTTAICISSTDISFRKEAEIQLSESEARFRSLVQNSSDIITVLGPDKTINYISYSGEKILGYKQNDLEGTNLMNYIHPQDRELVNSIFYKILSNQKFNPVIEYRFLHAGGYYVNLETTCTDQLKDKHIRGVVFNTRDVTERKIQEESLLLLERAIDSSRNGIIITDPNQTDNPVIYVNKAFEQISGYSYIELIGKNCRYLQGDDRDQPELEKLRNAIKEKKEISVVLKNYRKDGTLFWNELSIAPVFNRVGVLTNFIGVVNDISERKIGEQVLLNITHGISGTGEDFFQSLARYLSLELSADMVIIGELQKDKIKTKALFSDGKFLDNIIYELDNTLCKLVLQQGKVKIYEDVQKMFPDNPLFTTYDIYAYVGIPLIDSQGKKLGVLSVLGKKRFPNTQLIESILNIFSVRASVELEREYHLDALKVSESKFRSLAENSPDLIYIIDIPARKVIYFNRNDIFGYPPKALERSEAWLHIVHPEDLKRVRDHWRKFLQTCPAYTESIDYRVKKHDGDYEWVINRHTVVERTSNNKIKYVLLNITVITERKSVEEALRESEARLLALVENTSDLAWSIDKDLYITTINSAFKNLIFNSFKKAIDVGDNLLRCLPSQIKQEWLGLHSRALNEERFTTEFNTSVNGQNYYYEISFNPIYNEENIVTGVSVLGRDITRRKIAENDIIRTNFELDSFVYRASHDLRAPLRSVLGLINLVKTESDVAQRDYYLHLVDKSVNKLDTFISDLTNFSRNSRLDITIELINFSAILDDCIENLKYMEYANIIEIQREFDERYPFYSDSRRISIILQNLISNSIKYLNPRAEHSYVKIKIRTGQKHAEIVVEDNGKGIREEYLSKIFNMFFRASQDSYGSGLGLYITKQVVEKLKGSISVKSKFGQGTTFTVKLKNIQN